MRGMAGLKRVSAKLAMLTVGIGLLMLSLAAVDEAGAAKNYRSVASGPAKAVIGTKAWSFSFRDGRRKPALQEKPGTGTSRIGRLGFAVNGIWKHATRVVKTARRGKGQVLLLATTDPSRGLRVSVSPASHGSIRLQARMIGSREGVDSIGMSFRAPLRERYLGFGERSNAVDQRGNVVENWVGEGPYEANEYDLISNFVPKWALRNRPDATYFPMPWLLSTSGYGVLVENSNPSYFHLGTDRKDTWSVQLDQRVEGLANEPFDPPTPRSITLRFFAGPTPADVLRRFTAALGRQPSADPFFFGPWVQPKGDPQATLDKLAADDVPTSLLQTYVHYLPCQDQAGNEQGQRDFTADVHARGLAVTTYFNPMLCTSRPLFTELRAAGGLTENLAEEPYEYNYLRYRVGQFDFASEVGRNSYGDLLREALDHGYDGWMEDFGEYTPPDSVSSGGVRGMLEHNYYPRRYHCAAFEQTKRHVRPVARFVRSGFTGSPACSPIVWGGDPNTEWDFDGLRSAVHNGLSMGLSGVGVWGSDIGGFFSIFSDPLSPELLTRWVQFGAFSGVMRSQADGLQIDSRVRPQVLDPDQIENWRRYSKIRTQLYPYISAAAAEYRRTGLPLMRSMVIDFPNDRQAAALEDQYMFGPDLLVAPVTSPGVTSQKVHLPKGKWIDFWSTFAYDPGTGALTTGATAVRNGGGMRTLDAGPEVIPLLLRAGSMITTLDPDVSTLSPYGDDSVVGLDDRSDRNLFAFPRGRSEGRFEQRGRIASTEGNRYWKLQVNDFEARAWHIEASTTTMRKPFAVRCVKLNGRRLGARAWRATARRVELNIASAPKRFTLEFMPRAC